MLMILKMEQSHPLLRRFDCMIEITDEFVEPIANGNALPKFSLKAFPEKFEPGIILRVCNGSDKVLAIVESLVDQEQFSKMEPKDIAFKLKRVLI
jgi:hypothetical protein